VRSSTHVLTLRPGASRRIAWRVTSAQGAAFALANPLNRVTARTGDADVATVDITSPDGAAVVAHGPGRTTLTLTYQREHADGRYTDVVSERVRVTVRTG
jgi:hypothetical protein